jgi:predicted DNA-binding WGR domain protein
MSTYYLEFSEDEATGTSHKFYEASVNGAAVTLSYGRIGTPGTSSTQQCSSPEEAEKLALKKINEKKRKGYQEAVKGVRQKRTITRRGGESRPSTAKRTAPTVWRFETGSSAFGVFVNEQGCWVGNQDGRVYRLSHDAEVQMQYQLSEGVKCMVSDGEWMYVGCDDGNVYNLTGKTPRLAYEINPNIDIFWLDIANGLLAVSDAGGRLTTVNYEDEEQWAVNTGGSSAWMVRCDPVGRIFYGDSQGVRCYYGWEKETLVWQHPTSYVLFGWLDGGNAYAGTGSGQVLKFSQDGQLLQTYKADSSVLSCATSPGGLLLRRKRAAAVEAGHWLRLSAFDAILPREAVPGNHQRYFRLPRRERGRHCPGRAGPGDARPGHQSPHRCGDGGAQRPTGSCACPCPGRAAALCARGWQAAHPGGSSRLPRLARTVPQKPAPRRPALHGRPH